MKKILVLCLSLLMLTAFGCKSTSDGNAAPASAADAKSDSAKSAPACATLQLDPNAIVAEDAIAVMRSFAEGLEISARDAHGDCDKFIKNQNDLLEACEQNLGIAMAAAMMDESIKSSFGEKPSYELYDQMYEQCKGDDLEEIKSRINKLALRAAIEAAMKAEETK